MVKTKYVNAKTAGTCMSCSQEHGKVFEIYIGDGSMGIVVRLCSSCMDIVFHQCKSKSIPRI